MTNNVLPAEYAFSAALTREQVMEGCSATAPHAVISRSLIGSLVLDSDQMMRAWNENPEPFADIVECASAAIAKAKATVELMETAYARLILTGDVALNGVDEEKV